MSLPLSILIGFILASLIGFGAYQRAALTRSGVLGAVLTGTVIFGFGGFVPGFLLVAFFVSSTLLSKYKARAKVRANEKFQKSSRRDLGQALANGGWTAFLALIGWFAAQYQTDEQLQLALMVGIVGALATVTSDTWATEIGVLSRALPRMITTGRVVPVGTSGAISLLGTLTALCGGAFIGIMFIFANMLLRSFADFAPAFLEGAVMLDGIWTLSVTFILLAALVGLAGSLFDSILGATVQAIYFSEYDESQTEKKFDSQSSPTRLLRGWHWFDNDWVNFSASVFGSLAAGGIAYFIL